MGPNRQRGRGSSRAARRGETGETSRVRGSSSFVCSAGTRTVYEDSRQSAIVFQSSRSRFTQPRMSGSAAAAAERRAFRTGETSSGFCRLTPCATLALTANERVLAGGCLTPSCGVPSRGEEPTFVGSHCVLASGFEDPQRSISMEFHALSDVQRDGQSSSSLSTCSSPYPPVLPSSSLVCVSSPHTTGGRSSSLAIGFPSDSPLLSLPNGSRSACSTSVSFVSAAGTGCISQEMRRKRDETALFWCSVERETRARLEGLGFEGDEILNCLACCRVVRHYQMRSLFPSFEDEPLCADENSRKTSSRNKKASSDGSTPVGRSILARQQKEDHKRQKVKLRAVGHLLRTCVEIICASAAAGEGAVEVLMQPTVRLFDDRQCAVAREAEKLQKAARNLEASLWKRGGATLPEPFRDSKALLQLRKEHQRILHARLLEMSYRQEQPQKKIQGGERSSSENHGKGDLNTSLLRTHQVTEGAVDNEASAQDHTWPPALLVSLESLGIRKIDLTCLLTEFTQNHIAGSTFLSSPGCSRGPSLHPGGTGTRASPSSSATASADYLHANLKQPRSTEDVESVYSTVLLRVLATADPNVNNFSVQPPLSKNFAPALPWSFTGGTELLEDHSAEAAETDLEEELLALRAIFGDDAVRHFSPLSFTQALSRYQSHKVVEENPSEMFPRHRSHVIEVDVDPTCSVAVYLYTGSASRSSSSSMGQEAEHSRDADRRQDNERVTWTYPAHPPVLLWLRHPAACISRRRQVTVELLSRSMRSWRHGPMLFEWLSLLQEWSRSIQCSHGEEIAEKRKEVHERSKMVEAHSDCQVGPAPGGGRHPLLNDDQHTGGDRKAQQGNYDQCSCCGGLLLEGTGAVETQKRREEHCTVSCNDAAGKAQEIAIGSEDAPEESEDVASLMRPSLRWWGKSDGGQDNCSTVSSTADSASETVHLTGVTRTKAAAASRCATIAGARQSQPTSTFFTLLNKSKRELEEISSRWTSPSTRRRTDSLGTVVTSTQDRLEKQKEEAAAVAESRAARIAYLKALLEQEKEQEETEEAAQTTEQQEEDVSSDDEEEDDVSSDDEEEDDVSSDDEEDNGSRETRELPGGHQLGEKEQPEEGELVGVAKGLLEKLQAEDQKRLSDVVQATREASEELRSAWERRADPFQQKRRELPVYAYREEFLQGLQRQQVLVVCGETGCGKTTQLPQYAFEHLLQQGQAAACFIVVTQPRRICAISVAERIGEEMSEKGRVGGTVGYQIRMEGKRGPDTRLLVCTTGVLLRMMESQPRLETVTHLFIDEVHERDLQTDVLLVLVKRILPTRPTLRVVLMSATINAETFANYFGENVKIIHVKGRTYPVTTLFLQNVLHVTKHDIRLPFLRPDRRLNSLSAEQESSLRNHEPYASLPRRLLEDLWKYNEKEINYDLIVDLILWIDECCHSRTLSARSRSSSSSSRSAPTCSFECTSSSQAIGIREAIEAFSMSPQELFSRVGGGGGILVFLPGMAELKKCSQVLRERQTVVDAGKRCGDRESGGRGTSRFFVVLLHSFVPMDEQRRAFSVPPAGQRKVVLATNIAETSITIEDISFVIDTGLHRTTSFHSASRLSTVKDVWVTKANAQQRKGRAGRVAPGLYFGLYSTWTFEKKMEDHMQPEILVTPLEEICLQLFALRLDHPARLLAEALDAPDALRICAALKHLRAIQALERSDHPFPVIDAAPEGQCPSDDSPSCFPLQESIVKSRSACDTASQPPPSSSPVIKSPPTPPSYFAPAVSSCASALSHPSSFIFPSMGFPSQGCKTSFDREADGILLGCICSSMVCTVTDTYRPKGDVFALLDKTDHAGGKSAKRGRRRVAREDEKQQLLGYAKDDLRLSPLGWQLSRLPVDVAMGKLLILGAVFGVLDTTLTLAAILNVKTQLFSAFKYGREQADEAKRKLALPLLWKLANRLQMLIRECARGKGDTGSDHVALWHAVAGYEERRRSGKGEAARFATLNCLDIRAIENVLDTRRHIQGALLDAGLDSFCVSSIKEDERDTSCLPQSNFPFTVSVGPSDERKRGRCTSRNYHQQQSPVTTRHTSARQMDGVPGNGLSSPVGMLKDIRQLSLFRALVGAALYPQVAVEWRGDGIGRQFKTGAQAAPAYLHPASVDLKGRSRHTFFVYHEKLTHASPGGNASQTFLRDVSGVSPLALLLFCGDLEVFFLEEKVVLDGWICIQMSATDAALLSQLRTAFNVLLQKWMRNLQPRQQGEVSSGATFVLSVRERAVLDAIAELLANDELRRLAKRGAANCVPMAGSMNGRRKC
ncbi:atp-dependent rna helicase dhx36 isoform x2 [Cystoisospora suis]|uniref:RNA helicase n=1 Tax=Cystoisospora suis TaxID=483139 RepID=A0A2C6KE84_9APIC|nr:atp-dependent rna helicase dhx36 isoform x2 [Cystoisospora suis]